MEIECVLPKLKQAVAKTERITTKKASLDILECLLLSVEDNTLFIRATNLDIGIEITVPVKVTSGGEVAVPADVFSQYLSHLPDEGAVQLTHDGSTLSVETETTTTDIKTQTTEEFPSIPEVDSGQKISLSAENIVTGFDSVWYAASPSSMKPELSSVSVYTQNNDLYFVATDSFRLAEKSINNTNISDFSVLIPHQNVGEIIRIFRNLSDELDITIGDNQITIDNNRIHVSSRLIDGTFPDYQKIIPDESSVTVELSKQELANTLRLSDIFSDKFNQLTISVKPDDSVISFTTSNADVGENKTDIKADIKGEKITIQFNHQYITDAFQSLNGDTVVLYFSEDAPMVMKSKRDDTFQYLVMPMSN